MLILLSPAKTLDFAPLPDAPEPTQPRLQDDIRVLSAVTARLSPKKLQAMMDISLELADLNAARFRAFRSDPDPDAVKPAILAFAGDVYRGLDASSLSRADLDHAQERVRILSGLYGVLRPLDALQPYRLEMGTRLKTRRGETLYDFWGERIARSLNGDLASLQAQGGEAVTVNLASKEYSDAVDRKVLKGRWVSCEFKEVKDGKARVLGLFAKQARGMMARFVVTQRVDRVEGLRDFTLGGYRLDAEASRADALVFTRPQPAAVQGRAMADAD
jgi:hypothetical protein